MHVVPKVVRHDSSQDVLCHIVSILASVHIRRRNQWRTQRRTSRVPYATHRTRWARSCTTSHAAPTRAQTPSSRRASDRERGRRRGAARRTFVRVSELYTLSTGSSAVRTGGRHGGCWTDMLLVFAAAAVTQDLDDTKGRRRARRTVRWRKSIRASNRRLTPGHTTFDHEIANVAHRLD